jgi:hypothetical protein
MISSSDRHSSLLVESPKDAARIEERPCATCKSMGLKPVMQPPDRAPESTPRGAVEGGRPRPNRAAPIGQRLQRGW